jgi:hypothetical protein
MAGTRMCSTFIKPIIPEAAPYAPTQKDTGKQTSAGGGNRSRSRYRQLHRTIQPVQHTVQRQHDTAETAKQYVYMFPIDWYKNSYKSAGHTKPDQEEVRKDRQQAKPVQARTIQYSTVQYSTIRQERVIAARLCLIIPVCTMQLQR